MKTAKTGKNALLTLILTLMLLLSTVSCSAYADMPKSIGPDLSECKVVHVSTADEFLAAIGNDTLIEVEADLIDFTTATDYGKTSGEFYGWQQQFDGPELVILGVKNLQIIGQGKDKTTIQATPRYADVLSFRDCENIIISDLTAGHLKEAPGSCMGDVVNFENCSHVGISNCGFFGCGVMGLIAQNCSYLTVDDTEIYECSLMGGQVLNSDHVTFTNCTIHDCLTNSIFVDGKNDSNLWNETILQNGNNLF